MPLSLVSRHRIGQQLLGLPLQDRVGAEAERVPNAEPFARFVQGRHAEAAIATEVQDYIRPNLAVIR